MDKLPFGLERVTRQRARQARVKSFLIKVRHCDPSTASLRVRKRMERAFW